MHTHNQHAAYGDACKSYYSHKADSTPAPIPIECLTADILPPDVCPCRQCVSSEALVVGVAAPRHDSFSPGIAHRSLLGCASLNTTWGS